MNKIYLSFNVVNEMFAVEVTKVLEVLEKQKITKVPSAPESISGIINFRGEVVPVFETRSKFNLSLRDSEEPFVIIILELSAENDLVRIGAIVDKVQDVITVTEDDIKPVPAMSKEFNTSFLHGIYRLKDEFIMLLEVDKVFIGNELNAFIENESV